MRCCRDCATRLRRDSKTTRCAECRLVCRNERLDTPALIERRTQLLRTAAIAARIAELNESHTGRQEYR